MAAAIGWYGPLIDLCKASSYIGDYVQILVFVHKFTPIQYKIAGNGGEVVRMDVMVGDETRSYFPVTIWQKQMRSQISVGHVFLLQSMLLLVISRSQDMEILLKLGLSIVHLCNVCFNQMTLLHLRVWIN